MPRPHRSALLFLALTLALPLSARAQGVTVFAAASLGPALTEIAQDFRARTGFDVALSLAGSSALARQIAAGAPADLFVSASTDWMDWVAGQGAIQPDTRLDLATNRLVLVGAAEASPLPLTPDTDLVAALAGGRLAMALVDAVPAGQYGRAALESLGLWDAVAPHVAQTDNVRAALALVQRGEAPMGIVYASDVVGVDGVRVLAEFDPALHPAILYPLALTVQGTDPADRALWEALQTPEAAQVLARHGLMPLVGGNP